MGVNPDRKSGVEPLRRFAGELRQHPGNSCSVAVVSSDALHSQPDFIGYTERGAVTLGQLTASLRPAQEFQCNSACLSTPKSWGVGRVATAAGTRWCWEPLVTDLHSGGQDWIQSFFCPPRQGQSSAAILATEQPSLGTALLPPKRGRA